MVEHPKKPRGVSDARPVGFEAGPKATALKVRRIGNSLGVVLPKDVLAKLRAGEGDQLSVSLTAEGVTLALLDQDIQDQVEAGRQAMQRYKNALRELAK